MPEKQVNRGVEVATYQAMSSVHADHATFSIYKDGKRVPQMRVSESDRIGERGNDPVLLIDPGFLSMHLTHVRGSCFSHTHNYPQDPIKNYLDATIEDMGARSVFSCPVFQQGSRRMIGELSVFFEVISPKMDKEAIYQEVEKQAKVLGGEIK